MEVAGGEAMRYWCHMCSQVVNPMTEEGSLKCPFCQSGFVEEMTATAAGISTSFAPDRALSLWAPILLGMMGNPLRRRRRLPEQPHFMVENNAGGEGDNGDGGGDDTREERVPRLLGDSVSSELDRDLDSIIIRRRRNSAAILQLLQGIRAGMAAEPLSVNPESDHIRERERERERERLILINPFNQTIIVQGSYDRHQNQNPLGVLGDYIIGPGLDMLLQHLAENDPNRYGTPPAQKQVVEALPLVMVDGNLQCSVCLDDFEQGSEAKEMPCKHKFHAACILPWLEMHCSCPVCRYQLPTEDSKVNLEGSTGGGNNEGESSAGSGHGGDGYAEEGSGRVSARRYTLPWPLNTFFSPSTQTTGGFPYLLQSSLSSESESSTSAPGTASQIDEE